MNNLGKNTSMVDNIKSLLIDKVAELANQNSNTGYLLFNDHIFFGNDVYYDLIVCEDGLYVCSEIKKLQISELPIEVIAMIADIIENDLFF